MTVREKQNKLGYIVKLYLAVLSLVTNLVKILIHGMRWKMSWGDSVPA